MPNNKSTTMYLLSYTHSQTETVEPERTIEEQLKLTTCSIIDMVEENWF